MGEKAVIYARVSVRDEDVNNQIHDIRLWAQSHGYEVVGVFPDEAVTGASDPFQRPKFSQMLSFCKDNNIKTILVWDPARFGRSFLEAVQALKRLLDEGFKVIFTKYNLVADLEDIPGKVMFYTLSMVAELERDFMHMRLETARKAGKITHRPATPIPLDEVKKLLKKGWTFKQIYAYLVGQGHLRYQEKGQEKVMSYHNFVRRLNKEGIRKKKPPYRL